MMTTTADVFVAGNPGSHDLSHMDPVEAQKWHDAKIVRDLYEVVDSWTEVGTFYGDHEEYEQDCALIRRSDGVEFQVERGPGAWDWRVVTTDGGSYPVTELPYGKLLRNYLNEK